MAEILIGVLSVDDMNTNLIRGNPSSRESWEPGAGSLLSKDEELRDLEIWLSSQAVQT